MESIEDSRILEQRHLGQSVSTIEDVREELRTDWSKFIGDLDLTEVTGRERRHESE